MLEVVRVVNDDQGELEMSQQALAQLGALVGGEVTSYHRLERPTFRPLSIIDQPYGADPARLPGFLAAVGQHPAFCASHRGQVRLGTAVALSDFADLCALRRLSVHVDFHEPYGINDQLLCMMQHSNQQLAALTVNREQRGFSHRDRAVVELVIPHLSQAVARRQRLATLSAKVRSLGQHHDLIDQAMPRLSALTAREREVVEHLVGGATDREIARSLAISPRTVHKHLESVYRKLELGSRASLIALITRRSAGHNNHLCEIP
ncbi:MAG: helix-turn-helix transcriptional regulator [Actinomycetota bacterium]|nr:helix-turn-helix transcriptional regulator [Actinomycetota bacterium]